MIDRIARGVFVIELAALALPALISFFSSLVELADLSGIGAEETRGLGSAGTIAYALYGLTISAFCVLAVRYLIGGGAGVGRVTPIVWALALAGQAIVLPSVAWAGLSEYAPNSVRTVALLTFPALGLFIPLVHMLVAALIARRDRSRPSPA